MPYCGANAPTGGDWDSLGLGPVGSCRYKHRYNEQYIQNPCSIELVYSATLLDFLLADYRNFLIQ